MGTALITMAMITMAMITSPPTVTLTAVTITTRRRKTWAGPSQSAWC
jgi:hypothetical protein